jgi:hypothetical protein
MDSVMAVPPKGIATMVRSTCISLVLLGVLAIIAALPG